MITHRTMSYPISSDLFSVTPATYARVAVSRLAGRWWWLVILPPITFSIIALSDAAYIFAAMIWIFMLLPPAIMIAYYNYLLTPEAAMLSRRHKVTVESDGPLTISFPATDDEDTNSPEDIIILNSEIEDIQYKKDSMVLIIRKSTLKFLIIPNFAFPGNTWIQTLTTLSECT